MKDEAAFKRHFKKSVTAQGGFSISLSAPMLAGIPDLYCVLPGFAPVLLEAKWMKEINNKTDRQIPITKIQKHYLENCNKIYPGIAWCLVGYQCNTSYYAGLFDTEDRITTGTKTTVRISKHSELWDVKRLFELYVPKMNYVYQKESWTDPYNCASVSFPATTKVAINRIEGIENVKLAVPPHRT